MFLKRAGAVFALCLIVGCTGPNHVGNPVTLPIRGVLVGIENQAYAQRRARVSAYLAHHELILRQEAGQGMRTDEMLSYVPSEHHTSVRRDLAQIANDPEFVEKGTVILMVHDARFPPKSAK